MGLNPFLPLMTTSTIMMNLTQQKYYELYTRIRVYNFIFVSKFQIFILICRNRNMNKKKVMKGLGTYYPLNFPFPQTRTTDLAIFINLTVARRFQR